jgi:hypothetical protein
LYHTQHHADQENFLWPSTIKQAQAHHNNNIIIHHNHITTTIITDPDRRDEPAERHQAAPPKGRQIHEATRYPLEQCVQLLSAMKLSTVIALFAFYATAYGFSVQGPR